MYFFLAGKCCYEQVFDELYEKCVGHYNTLDNMYVFDGFCGSNPTSRKKVEEHYMFDNSNISYLFLFLKVFSYWSFSPHVVIFDSFL